MTIDPRPRILAIDDTPANLLTLGAALAGSYDLQTATSGEMGIALARQAPPDLILLDVMMPAMDGFETCRRLKAEPRLKDVPVIFVTAADELAAELEGLSVGGADYLVKPINLDIARRRIDNLLERESLHRRVIAQRDQLEALLAERLHVEEELRIAAVAFNSPSGMVITDPRGVIIKVNASFTRLTGYSAAEAIGQTPALLKSGRHDALFYQRMWGALKEKGWWQNEVWNRRKDGQIYAELLTITAIVTPEGATTHYVAIFNDITEDKRAEAEIHRLAYYDALTRLPNRRLLQDRLGQALATAARSGRHGALFFIDLDNFKALNDTRGHEIGDLLLVEVAQRLRACVREGDTVARTGGDEFVLLAEGLAAEAGDTATLARKMGKKLHAAIAPAFTLDGLAYQCRLSVGVCLFTAQDSVEELFKRADLALHQAKNAGRNSLRFFDPAMQAVMELRSALEAELADALDLDQLRVHYQPQYDTARRVIGVEALLRWQHPERGLIAPNVFIPLAEDTGLILPIGLWVMESACALIRRWAADTRAQGLEISVNVSARQFRRADFVAEVRGVLERSGANPQRLKLELTESLVLENVEDTIAKMHAIKALGVRLSMDDFGTGYSSLSYLAQLPLDQLKIDQSFVRNLPGGKKDETITRTIITLGRELEMDVIAEGVESETQREFLEAHGCHAYQGYLFGRPVPLEALDLFAATPESETVLPAAAQHFLGPEQRDDGLAVGDLAVADRE
jgi:diguanylate cyclase (GGDEF)-like protein/PAS domain S-box-containing protein